MTNSGWVERLFQFLGVMLGSGVFGHWIAGRRDKQVDAQTLIDQIQEERNYTNAELKERDKKIDGLYQEIAELRKQVNEVTHENLNLKWQLERAMEENVRLKEENAKLKALLKGEEG